MQKFDAPAPEECAKCHKGPLAKLLSKTAFVLKGNGWYVTDFRSGGDKKAAPAKTDGGTGGEPKPGESKPEAKPAETKTETKTETKAAPSTP